jgi:hypothetical protein
MTDILNTLLADFAEEKDFAKAIKKSERTTKRWRDQPDGLPYTKIGSTVYIHIPTAREWMLARMKRPNPRRDSRPRKANLAAEAAA